MTPRNLIDLLTRILEAHPEAEEAQIWAEDPATGGSMRVRDLRFSKRHKPARIILED